MTRARDIAGGTIFTGADHTKLDGIATGATAYVHPTGSGNNHVPAAGAAGQLLQYASAGTATWATISTGTPDVVFPSDWASPTASYTSSGTYSKGSLSDDDYVWVYILSGGGGGSSRGGGGDSVGGSGGSSMFLYSKAGILDGATYVVAAGKAGSSPNNNAPSTANTSSFTLNSANGSDVFTPQTSNDTTAARINSVMKLTKNAVSLTSYADFTHTAKEPDPYTWNDLGLPSGMSHRYLAPAKQWYGNTTADDCIFGGGNGGAFYNTTKLHGGSQFAGNGGATASQGVAGTFPGGGGGGSQSASNSGGAGAAGIIRIYHV